MSLKHWENYYRTGAVASCPMGQTASYTLELHDLWSAFFAELADGARILDIGTGNGAIALIASETAARVGRKWEIHGTDLAQIDPQRDVRDGTRRFAGILIHPGVATESLPFADSHFEAVSGQYALEYTDMDKALAEIARVLKPGGRACFIVHHADSIIAQRGRESLQQSELVLNGTKIMRKLRRFLESEQRSRNAARGAWQDLGAAVGQLRQAAAQAQSALTLNVTLDAVQKLVDARQRIGLGATQHGVDQVENEIRNAVHRLQDLVGAAKTVEEMEQILASGLAAGLSGPAARPQHHDGDKLVGWRLDLQKP